MTDSLNPVSPTQRVHFELPPGRDYRLSASRGRYSLVAHTAESRSACAELVGAKALRVTHFADITPTPSDKIQLMRVYGPPDENGIDTLVSMAVAVDGDTPLYTTDDLANALMFLHPSVTVLTAEAAPVVQKQIAASAEFEGLCALLKNLRSNGQPWNTSSFSTDANGKRVPNPYAPGDMYQYDLVDSVANLRTLVAPQAIQNVNNAPELLGVRYHVLDGAPYRAAQAAPPSRTIADSDSGYNVELQDPGPNYGISAEISNFSAKDGFTLSIILTNSYVRHCSAFVSFISGDGKTPIVVPDNLWMVLAKDAIWAAYQAWLLLGLPELAIDQLFDTKTNTLKYLGTLSAEGTFLGIPVATASSQFTFSLPNDQANTVSKTRVLVGSLGLPSGNDWDPQAAAIGIGMTALLDLIIPTASIAATVGLPDSDLFSTTFSKVAFFGPAVAGVIAAVWDIINNPNMAESDLVSLIVSITNSLASNILGAANVAAALAAVFGAEELAEAVPIVGWALKAEAIEAAIEQLAQTVGEVLGSQRVVEFDITVTMTDRFTLVPADASGFPETATHFTVTAQYSDVSGYVYTGEFPDPKVSEVTFSWEKMPVGGTVSFLVAFYSKEGYLVGKGVSPVISNFITEGQGALVVPPISITQLLYPLSASTTYGHQQLLQYLNGAHAWLETASQPTETAKNLGTGSGGNILDQVTGITLNSDLGVLGYSFQASGQNVPLIGTTEPLDLPLYTFQNVSSGVNPEAGLMFVSSGYNRNAGLVYLRSAAAIDNGGAVSAVANSFFYVDPVVDSAAGYHLRGITPVTDSSIPPDSTQRIFDQSTDLSWGRFHWPLLPTSMAIHSNGVVVGVTNGYSKLAILNLSQAPVASADAPWAQVVSGPGTRPGLVNLPQQVAIAPNQTIYVLEAGNKRIQAFSRGGHPVQAFPDLPTPYWIPLYVESGDPADITYAAMSVEIKGYIYVLSIEGNGYTAEQYRLDIYTPDGHHLLRQRGINVAALTVDLWRNVYTLNYSTILGPDGRTEPTVSEWIPSTPNAI